MQFGVLHELKGISAQ